MNTNSDLTIFNKWANTKTGKMEYKRTVIQEVNWYTDQKTALTADGLVSADLYKVRIPGEANTKGKVYIAPEKYIRLAKEEVEKHWTIAKGDLFVNEIVEIDVNSYQELNETGYLAGKVNSWSDNRRGTAHHFRFKGAS